MSSGIAARTDGLLAAVKASTNKSPSNDESPGKFWPRSDKAQRLGRRIAAFTMGEYFKTYVLNMDGFSVDVASLVSGLALDALVKTCKIVFQFVKRNVTIRVEINSTDPAFEWITFWLSQHPYSKKVTDVTVRAEVGRPNSGGDEPRKPTLSFLPASGQHWLSHGNKYVWLSRKIRYGTGGNHNSGKSETITLTMLGRSRTRITNLVADAMNMYLERDRACTVVYVGDQYGGWRRSRSRPIRSLGSVILQGSLGDDLLADARSFLDSEAWYLDRGIPYRRGYLLYGPPGSGKTSFITALAGALQLNIYVVSLANPALTDETINDLFTDTPQQCVLLLEDIDSCFEGDDLEMTSKSKVTFSGVLNVLDGVSAPEGRILVMTTNHPSMLSPALVRPGRVDVRAHFPWASAKQMFEMFKHFYASHPDAEKLATKFVQGVQERFPSRVSTLEYGDVDFSQYEDEGTGMVSMASLQGHLMKYRDEPQAAVNNRWEILQGRQQLTGKEACNISSESGTSVRSPKPRVPKPRVESDEE